jgi:hypothetical protein
VVATVDALGNATYEVGQPAAWDEITAKPASWLHGCKPTGATPLLPSELIQDFRDSLKANDPLPDRCRV